MDAELTVIILDGHTVSLFPGERLEDQDDPDTPSCGLSLHGLFMEFPLRK
jgi:hypothetical protein